jgi:phosphoglycerate dehydrogenase-like enzyme
MNRASNFPARFDNADTCSTILGLGQRRGTIASAPGPGCRQKGSTVRVWVPYPEFVEDVESVGDDVHADVFTGQNDPPASIEEVAFYVAPYSFTAGPLQLTAKMPSLRVLQLLTAGFENALQYVPDGLTVCNAHGVHDASTAELALALMLSSLRGIPEFVLGQQQHQWLHVDRPSLADKTVLILGYGSIGTAIERRLLPFETTVVRVASKSRPDDDVHGVDELPELLPAADIVVVIAPLTPATRGLVDARFLATLHDGALLVNVARGAIVDTDALLAELTRGRLRAALDVTDPEPLPADHPLWSAPGLLLSPHVGGNSSAFLPRARALVRAQVARFAAGEPVENVVAGPPSSG